MNNGSGNGSRPDPNRQGDPNSAPYSRNMPVPQNSTGRKSPGDPATATSPQKTPVPQNATGRRMPVNAANAPGPQKSPVSQSGKVRRMTGDPTSAPHSQKLSASQSVRTERSSDAKGNVFLSGLKNFGIVFASCLVIFGLLASLAVSFVTSAVDGIFDEKNHLEEILNKDAEPTSSDTDGIEVPEGESFTSLIIVTDFDIRHYSYYPQGDDLTELRWHANDRDIGILSAGYKTIGVKMSVIVRCDKERREYTITPISTHTRVYTTSGYKQLGDLYTQFGPQFFIQKIEALTGFGIDYFFVVNALEAPKMIESLGQFNVDIPKDIYSDGATFGTAERRYETVTQVIPPETIPVETQPPETEDKSKDTEAEPNTEPETETETETEEEEDEEEKEPRTSYSLVVSAGTVTVTPDNIQALLMFDDYENGVSDRLSLEYQLVRGALLRLASLSSEERLKFYDDFAVETSVVDCSSVFEEREAEDEKDGDKDEQTETAETEAPEQEDDGKGKNSKKKKKNVIHGIFDDGKINTDMSRKSAELKNDLIGAALRFNVTYLEYSGHFVNGYFAPNLTEATSQFLNYKLPRDPEKMVTIKGNNK